MATDVELSPRHTAMACHKSPSDLKESASSNSSRKAKGILNFFSSLRKTSDSGDTISLKAETKGDVDKKTPQRDETCSEKSKEAETTKSCQKADTNMKSKKVEPLCVDSGADEKESKREKSPAKAVQQQSKSSTPTPVESSKSDTLPGGKKKRLATKKKANGKREVDQINTEIEQEEKDDTKNIETKSTPQEMDYEEFMKTFSQSQNGSDDPEVSGEVKEQPAVPCTDDNVMKNSSEEKVTKLNSHVESKPAEKSSSKDALSKTKVPLQQTESKKGSTSNAFSLLMQARTSKKKKLSESDSCCEDTGDKSSGMENASNTKDDGSITIPDEGDEVPLGKSQSSQENCSTPSVLNFFSKSTKSTKSENDNGRPVVVEVDIHCDPMEQKLTPRRGKSNNIQKKKTEKKLVHDENEIVFLSSETIEIDEEESKITKSKKKRNASKSDPSCTDLSQTPGVHVSRSENKCEQSADDTKRKDFLQDSTPPPDSFVRKSQATLQFGKAGGLSMNTSVLAKPEKKCKKDKHEAADFEENSGIRKVTTRNRRKAQKICSSDSEDTEANNVSQELPRSTTPSRLTKSKQKKMLSSTRLRKSLEPETGGDTKDFTPRSKLALTGSANRSRAQELLQKAKQKKKDSKQKQPKTCETEKTTAHEPAKEQSEEVLLVEEEPATSEQGCRRQSRRLAAQQVKREVEEQQMKLEAEQQRCISVDSDSCSDEAQTPERKRTKKVSSHTSLKNSSTKHSPKKPVGKLAPIFAKKKPGEASDSAPEQPPEDPELVRKRREFLMSGVPSELKWQAACAAPVVASECAPFPEISHVQQQAPVEPGVLDVWSLAVPEKIRAMCKEEDEVNKIGMSTLDWKSLQWQKVVAAQNKPDLFNGPPSDCISKEVQETLLKELQQTDPTFPFTTLCDKFRTQLSDVSPKSDTLSGETSSAKRTSSVDSDIVIIDELADTAAAQSDRDSQWPEALQPRSASEMIGNESSIRRLKYWLEEWKVLVQREARLSARWAANGGDSDFDYSGDDSDEDCNQLCNTMLLIGPHGVGKTAAVYALADQLSYKVFEVNASSSRQGRHILSQLQEATQSHQVAQKKDGIILSPSALAPVCKASPVQPEVKSDAKKKSNAVPKAFANFFKKTECATESKESTASSSPKRGRTTRSRESPKEDSSKRNKEASLNGSSRKRRKVHDVEDSSPKKRRGEKKADKSVVPLTTSGKEGEEVNLAGCLNLTSTSLILFDEVDLVFEEDSGFLQTVQHFINTTKIPIVMTTSDPGFERQINARFESLFFTAPPVISAASYLQTVSMAAGMRTCPDDTKALVATCKGDMRQALLTFQFLFLSGGGMTKELRPVCIRPAEKTNSCEKKTRETRDSPSVSVTGDDGDSDGDFVSLKPVRKKARRIVDDDDSSEMAASSDAAGVRAAKGKDVGEVIVADTLPSVHLKLYESLLGVSCDLTDLFIKCMQVLQKQDQELEVQFLRDRGNYYSFPDAPDICWVALEDTENLAAPVINGECNISSLPLLTRECLDLKTKGLDILYPNILNLLPLPKTAMPGRWHPPSVPSQKSVKRKRIRSDIFDSEGSDEETIDEKETVKVPSAELTVEETKNDLENAAETLPSADRQQDPVETPQEDPGQAEEPEASRNNEQEVSAVIKEEEKKEVTAVALETKDNEEETMEVDVSSSFEKDSRREEKSGTEGGDEPCNTVPQEVKCSLKGSRTCTDRNLGSKLLSSFAHYYESLSALDNGWCHRQHPQAFLRDRWRLLPGTDDVASREDNEKCDQLREDLGVETGVRSSRLFWQSVDCQVQEWRTASTSDGLPDGCSIPVPYPDSSFKLAFTSEAEVVGVSETYNSVAESVMNSLPLTAYSSLNPVTLDYLPMLRAISQAERCRQLAKTKRRFHHHFDNIGLCLGEATVTALCEEFPTVQKTT